MNHLSHAQNEGRSSDLWFRFKSQIWVVPATISILFAVLAVAIMKFAPVLDANAALPWWLFSGDARTARDLLGTILSGLITMTSLVLSMTFVVLTLAANQLGPRLVVILTGDREIQSALGLFVGSITYVLIVLRSINDELGQDAVPHLSVTVASALVLICLMVLLFYVHKISRSIVSDTVVERVSNDLKTSLESALEEPRESTATLPDLGGTSKTWISLGKSGYIRTIDYGELVEIARKHGGFMRLVVRPGEFVMKHGQHVEVRAQNSIDDDAVKVIRAQFKIGPERSPAQDLEYSVRHLVESATRALSASTKDPFTVVAVIDKLTQSLELLIGDRKLPSANMTDDEGTLRVRCAMTQLGDLVSIAFDQIRQGAAGDPFVLSRIADALGRLLALTRRPDAEVVLEQQLDRLEGTVKASIAALPDRQDCLARIDFARKRQPLSIDDTHMNTQSARNTSAAVGSQLA